MNMKQTEALKLALEWIGDAVVVLSHTSTAIQGGIGADAEGVGGCSVGVVAAIREALAEPPAQQQEPVAYSYTSRITGAQGFSHHPMPRFIDSESWDIQPLYTSPPASKPWVGLTDEEKSDLWCESTGRDCVNEDTHVFADAIEAKLREKNA